MDVLVKLNKQTSGRDRIFRLLQYLSKFSWYQLQNNPKFVDKNAVTILKSLEYQLSTFRKLLRWGLCLDTIYSALPLLSEPLTTRHFLEILSRVSNSLFYLADHILWLGRADLCQVDTKKWNHVSNRYWLYTITLNLCKNFQDLSKLIFSQGSHPVNLQSTWRLLFTHSLTNNWLSWNDYKSILLIKQHKILTANFIKNFADIFIPLTTLGYLKFSPGMIGLCGVISSLAGLYILIDMIVV